MLIDFSDPASVRAWLEVRPIEHRALLAALLALPHWERWREQLRELA